MQYSSTLKIWNHVRIFPVFFRCCADLKLKTQTYCWCSISHHTFSLVSFASLFSAASHCYFIWPHKSTIKPHPYWLNELPCPQLIPLPLYSTRSGGDPLSKNATTAASAFGHIKWLLFSQIVHREIHAHRNRCLGYLHHLTAHSGDLVLPDRWSVLTSVFPCFLSPL